MSYHDLLVTGLSHKHGIEHDTPSIVIELCHSYFGAFLYPTLKSKVRIKNIKCILRTFESVNRDDYWLWMKKYNDKFGVVVAHHITNGVQVEFINDNDKNIKIWYEPCCFSQINGECIKMDKRYFIDDKVLFYQKPQEINFKINPKYLFFIDKVGTVCKYQYVNNKNNKINPFHSTTLLSVGFGDNEINNLPSKCVKMASTFFGHHINNKQNKKINNLLNFEPFVLNEKVKIKDDFSDIQFGFDIANRDDCWEWMKIYCGKTGNIIRFHVTNGICLQMKDNQTIWYEPLCIEKITDKSDNYEYKSLISYNNDIFTKYHQKNRLLIGTKVKLQLNGNKYNGRVGKIVLHFPQNRYHNNAYKQISVKFGNDIVQILPNKVYIVKQYYDL